MRKRNNNTESYLKYIIHPGKTLEELIGDRNISPKELADKMEIPESDINAIINGQKNISSDCAKSLEKALGIATSFWTNLQANYDRELLEFEKSKQEAKKDSNR